MKVFRGLDCCRLGVFNCVKIHIAEVQRICFFFWHVLYKTIIEDDINWSLIKEQDEATNKIMFYVGDVPKDVHPSNYCSHRNSDSECSGDSGGDNIEAVKGHMTLLTNEC